MAIKRMPTDIELMAIPLAGCGEYELSDIESKRLRTRLYSINKNNAAGWRFRTMREGRLLLVWRLVLWA